VVAVGTVEVLAEGAERGRRSLPTVLLIRSLALSLELVGGADYRRMGWGIVRSCADGRLQAEALDTSPAGQELRQ
jgi:hypothetical protein